MSNLKSMATLAKERLKRGNYTNAEKAKAKNAMNINSYFLKNFNSIQKLKSKVEFVSISSEIEDSFVNKVNQILSSQTEVYNPIGQLVDKAIYDNLSEVEKQFYVLTIVDKFNKVKQNYNYYCNQKIG